MTASLDDLLSRGEDAWTDGEIDEALDLAEQALELDPASSEALELKASALAELGEYEEADEAYAELLRRQPKNAALMLAAADVLIRQPGDDRERIEAGLDLLERAEGAAKRDDELRAELELLRGVALSQLGDCEEALRSFEVVLKLDPENGEAKLERGIALFELCRLEEAARDFAAISREFPEEPWAWHYQGLLAERRGRDPEPFFAKARRFAPEEFPPPVHLSAEQFDAAVAEAIEGLPEHAQPHLENAVIDVEPFPSDDELMEGGISPAVLGLFRGTPIDERSPVDAGAQQTVRITLYQKNLERFARTREELIEEIGVTVLHEVGHLLGLDEDELYERGLD